MVTIHPDRIALPTSRLPASLPAALVQSGLLATDTSDSGPAHGAFMAAGLVSGGQLQGREQARETITSGFAAVDALLPTGGLRRGSLVEWLAGPAAAGGEAGNPKPSQATAAASDVTSGAGAVSLAFAVACRIASAPAGPRSIVVVDRGGWFHPPAVLPWLGDSQQLVVARPSHDDDEIWAIDQALRCRGVAAVVAWPRGVAGRSAWGSREPAHEGGQRGRSKPGSQWTVAMRRWQLAARASGAIGLVVRPAAAAREPSWAEAKLAVSPLPGGTLLARRLQILKVGGSWSGGLEGRTTETVLDLARGCEGRLSREPARSVMPPQRGEPAATWAIDIQGGIRGGGLSCRAS
jgi:protein ImuA